MNCEPVLEIDRVSKSYSKGDSINRALREFSLVVCAGEVVGLIGESGSGKSTLTRLVLGLERPDSGRVLFKGEDLGKKTIAQLREFQARVGIVFQEPFEALDPEMKVSSIIAEPMALQEVPKKLRRGRVLNTAAMVGISPQLLDAYPTQLSGGQQQRVGIARSLVLEPDLLVLDEPTSSLDLSVQAQILLLLRSLISQLGLTVLFVTHDLDVAEYLTDRIAVMRAGSLVEIMDTSSMKEGASAEYTQSLMGDWSAMALGRVETTPVNGNERKE